MADEGYWRTASCRHSGRKGWWGRGRGPGGVIGIGSSAAGKSKQKVLLHVSARVCDELGVGW